MSDCLYYNDGKCLARPIFKNGIFKLKIKYSLCAYDNSGNAGIRAFKSNCGLNPEQGRRR